MGKPYRYAGTGDWIINVRLPEPLARQVADVLAERGSTLAEFTRMLVADYMKRRHN